MPEPPPLGSKWDGEKPRWSLLPYESLTEVVEVLTSGARKYSPDNWKYVPDGADRYFSAGMRHLTAWKMGEKKDLETGKSHLSHAICCFLFLIWFEKNGGPCNPNE